MSEYSYTFPWTRIKLSSSVAEEVRSLYDKLQSSDDNIAQLKKHISKKEPVPFEVLRKFWKTHKNGTALHKWISDCSLVLPEVVVPPRNEELEKRCQKLRAQQKHTEYNHMVNGIDKKVGAHLGERAIWKEIRNQYIAVLNTVLTIGGVFVFVYKAVEYSLPTPNPASQVLAAILVCLLVAVAELYFLLRDI